MTFILIALLNISIYCTYCLVAKRKIQPVLVMFNAFAATYITIAGIVAYQAYAQIKKYQGEV